MSFKWTPTQARTSNIVDSSQFNESYRAYKGALNGSLDRSNLPNASIDRTRLANNFAHKIDVSNFNDTAILLYKSQIGYVKVAIHFDIVHS